MNVKTIVGRLALLAAFNCVTLHGAAWTYAATGTDSEPKKPAAALAALTVPADLEVEQVLSEPEIGQPIFAQFDERGRLWVVQYLQYPFPAGLKILSEDKIGRAHV